jgi:peptide chain release factor 2
MDITTFDEYRRRLGELKEKLSALKKTLDVGGKESEIVKLEAQTAADGFWESEDSTATLKKISSLKAVIAKANELAELIDDTATLIDFSYEESDESVSEEIAGNLDKIDTTIESESLLTLLSGEYDQNNAILTLHSGAGGTEACDWVEMLYRMYMRWADRRGFAHKTLDFLDGEEAGLKSVTMLIEGDYAYGWLKSEMGVHRLVRVSPFDSGGRRHTSFASCEVMPEIEEDDKKIDIPPDDLKVDTYRSSGAGGQHVNKTESAIRITHIPTGVVVTCQTERSQMQNRATAMKMLKSKLAEIKERENLEKISDIKGVQKDIAWGSQIRSYVFMPYTLAKDHRTGAENGNINAVMDGDIEKFMAAYLTMKARESEERS